ncbi:MAG: hypothetical protein PVI26_11530 [Chitinispirillia bacterium]|jgi:hypothetical protein
MSLRKWINQVYAKIHIKQDNRPYTYYVDKLKNNITFSFSRYGPGEWNVMFGNPGYNNNDNEYFLKMGDQLKSAVIRPLEYIYAIQHSAIRNNGKKIACFLKKNNSSLIWQNANVFQHANREGQFHTLIQELKKKQLVIIGPEHLYNLKDLCFKNMDFIEIPARNCYLKLNNIINKILTYNKNKSGVIYSLSASMAANLIIHKLFPILGKENWLIDFGSVWDTYFRNASA